MVVLVEKSGAEEDGDELDAEDDQAEKDKDENLQLQDGGDAGTTEEGAAGGGDATKTGGKGEGKSENK